MEFYNPFSLENRNILITGASSGIGKATAIECSKLGAKIILTGRNLEGLENTYNSLSGEGHKILSADLRNIVEIERLTDEVSSLDGLVNNAGQNILQLVPFIKNQTIKDIFQINVFAPIILLKTLVKKKKLRNGSSIVFTSSISGKDICYLGNSLYSTTKGALISFMKNAALDLAHKKIRCNAVLPGLIESPLKQKKREISSEQWETNKKMYPLERLGQPKDVALAIVFLLSEASCWITGAEIKIDGGRSLV